MKTTELRRCALEAFHDEQQRQQLLEDIENTGYLKRALKRTLNIEVIPTAPIIEIEGLVFRGSGDQHSLFLHVRMPDGEWAYVSGLAELGSHIAKMDGMQRPALSETESTADESLAHDLHDAVVGMLREADAAATRSQINSNGSAGVVA